MNKKTVLATALAVFALLPAALTAQNDSVPARPKNRYAIAWQPLQTYNSGVKFDFERRINNTRTFWQVAPSIYFPFFETPEGEQNVTVMAGEYNTFWGAGTDLNCKYFFTEKERGYLAGGLTYSYFDVKYYGVSNIPFTENGLDYVKTAYGAVKQHINKTGFNVFLGYQNKAKYFLFDMFAGLGYRYSFVSNSAARHYDRSSFEFGYRGLTPILGIRLGAKFGY